MNKEEQITISDFHSIYREKEILERILSTLNSGLVLIDTEMNVIWANETIKKMFPGQELRGKKCYTAAENRTTPCNNCQSVKAFKDGKIHERELQNRLSKKWHYVIAFPLKDEQGRVVNVLESTTDITDRKQAEISLVQAYHEIKLLKNKLEEENIFLKGEIREACVFTDIIGSSKALRYVLTRIQQVAETDTSVMIHGETGVGKELIARAIHDSSPRSKQPFISVNCAAIASSLIESELFGHERGAFTDAQQLRKGRFELADGGTLFLDEVSELPLETQSKLLRVLQDGRFERVGSSQTLDSDVRIIIATNRDLQKEIREGRFRPDLFYRLNVFPISVPPLRQRVEDIHLLVDHFVQFFNKKFGKQMNEISEPDMEKLKRYQWPGNVRELRNIIERAMITSQGSKLSLQDMAGIFTMQEDELQQPDPIEENQILPLEEVERRHIQNTLEAVEWRISGSKGAARVLQINASTLRSRMKKLGIQKSHI